MALTIKDLKIGICWLVILMLIVVCHYLTLGDSRVEADTEAPTTQVTVTNATPVLDQVYFYDDRATITLNEWDGGYGTTTATTTFRVYDGNGYADIATTTLVIYSTTLGDAQSCASSTQGCYRYDDFGWAPSNDSLSFCDRYDESGNYAYFWCTTTLHFFATGTDSGENSAANWVAYASTSDLSDATANGNDTFEVGVLQAFILSTTSITYPSLGVTEDSANSWSSTTATTSGNYAIDIHLDGGNMTKNDDDSVHLGAYNQKFTTSSALTWSTVDSDTATPVRLPTTTDDTVHVGTHDFTMARATTTPPGPTTADGIYWGIYIPAGTAIGTYASTTNFTATSTILNP